MTSSQEARKTFRKLIHRRQQLTIKTIKLMLSSISQASRRQIQLSIKQEKRSAFTSSKSRTVIVRLPSRLPKL